MLDPTRLAPRPTLLRVATGRDAAEPVDPPFDAVANQMAIESLAPLVDLGRAVGATLVGLGLLVGAASLVVRFRRSLEERLRLRWLALAVTPLVLCSRRTRPFWNCDRWPTGPARRSCPTVG